MTKRDEPMDHCALREHETLLPKMVAALAPTIPETKMYILIVVDKKTGDASIASTGASMEIRTMLRSLLECDMESFEPVVTEAVRRPARPLGRCVSMRPAPVSARGIETPALPAKAAEGSDDGCG